MAKKIHLFRFRLTEEELEMSGLRRLIPAANEPARRRPPRRTYRITWSSSPDPERGERVVADWLWSLLDGESTVAA